MKLGLLELKTLGSTSLQYRIGIFPASWYSSTDNASGHVKYILLFILKRITHIISAADDYQCY